MENKKQNSVENRIALADYIRVMACLTVMVAHACGKFFNMGGSNSNRQRKQSFLGISL